MTEKSDCGPFNNMSDGQSLQFIADINKREQYVPFTAAAPFTVMLLSCLSFFWLISVFTFSILHSSLYLKDADVFLIKTQFTSTYSFLTSLLLNSDPVCSKNLLLAQFGLFSLREHHESTRLVLLSALEKLKLFIENNQQMESAELLIIFSTKLSTFWNSQYVISATRSSTKTMKKNMFDDIVIKCGIMLFFCCCFFCNYCK